MVYSIIAPPDIVFLLSPHDFSKLATWPLSLSDAPEAASLSDLSEKCDMQQRQKVKFSGKATKWPFGISMFCSLSSKILYAK